MSTAADADFDPAEFEPPPRPKRDDDVEMDITPMIDITFLLLIFFLVASRPDETTAIQLPLANNGDAVSLQQSIIFSVGEGGIDEAPLFTGDGKVKANQIPSEPEARDEMIRKYIEEKFSDGKTSVVIKADRGVACRDIATIMKSVSKVEGVSEINLGVLEAR